jgi:ABC-type sugar transport system permease subunit
VSRDDGGRRVTRAWSLHRAVARLHARRVWHAYLFIAPVVLLFGIFRVVPSVQTLLYSVYRVELLKGRFTFIGLENFQELLVDPSFHRAASNTLIYVLVIVPVSAGLGLLFAVLFDARFPLRDLFKAIYFAPMVTSTVAAAVVWWWLYNPQFGLFNVVLRLLHLPTLPWLMSSHTALASVIIFSVWKSLGYNMVVYLAGLQAVPTEFLEAAKIDGAGGFQRFLRIVFPLLAPTTAFLLIYNSIQAFQVFDQIFVLTSGGPAGATNVVVLDLYRQAFERFNFGYASAQAMVLFLLTLGVTVLQFAYSRRFEVRY